MILSTFIRPSLALLSLLLIIFGWVGITYYVRTSFIEKKSKDYVSAAVAMGQSHRM